MSPRGHMCLLPASPFAVAGFACQAAMYALGRLYIVVCIVK